MITTLLIPILNCEALDIDTKYYKTIYNNNGNIILDNEITEFEYNHSQLLPLDLNLYSEYKQVTLKVINNKVTIYCSWKKIPKYKSFDVVALRGEDVIFENINAKGMQLYTKDNTTNTIHYNYNGLNTKVFNNGIGISMNLVDNATEYTLSLSVPYIITGDNPVIYGNYQHAIKNIDLNTSKKYSLSPLGYGKVIQFEDSVKSYYDGMGGVNISL